MVAIVPTFVGPAVAMTDDVVMTTERSKVGGLRGVAVGPGDSVVDIAFRRWHPATGVDTGRVEGEDLPGL